MTKRHDQREDQDARPDPCGSRLAIGRGGCQPGPLATLPGGEWVARGGGGGWWFQGGGVVAGGVGGGGGGEGGGWRWWDGGGFGGGGGGGRRRGGASRWGGGWDPLETAALSSISSGAFGRKFAASSRSGDKDRAGRTSRCCDIAAVGAACGGDGRRLEAARSLSGLIMDRGGGWRLAGATAPTASAAPSPPLTLSHAGALRLPLAA